MKSLFQRPFPEPRAWLLQDDVLSYSLGIYDNFTTAGGEELGIVCQDTYSLDWRTKVDAMAMTLNEQLASGALCSSQNGKISVLYSTTGFSAQETQVGQLQ